MQLSMGVLTRGAGQESMTDSSLTNILLTLANNLEDTPIEGGGRIKAWIS